MLVKLIRVDFPQTPLSLTALQCRRELQYCTVPWDQSILHPMKFPLSSYFPKKASSPSLSSLMPSVSISLNYVVSSLQYLGFCCCYCFHSCLNNSASFSFPGLTSKTNSNSLLPSSFWDFPCLVLLYFCYAISFLNVESHWLHIYF